MRSSDDVWEWVTSPQVRIFCNKSSINPKLNILCVIFIIRLKVELVKLIKNCLTYLQVRNMDMSQSTWNEELPSGVGDCVGLYEGASYRAYDYTCGEEDYFVCQKFLQ